MAVRDFKFISAALGALALKGCVSMDAIAPPVTTAMAGTGSRQEALEKGRRIYTGACTACHAADPVGKYSVPRWREIVDEMSERTKLTEADQVALLDYIAAAHKVVPVAR